MSLHTGECVSPLSFISPPHSLSPLYSPILPHSRYCSARSFIQNKVSSGPTQCTPPSRYWFLSLFSSSGCCVCVYESPFHPRPHQSLFYSRIFRFYTLSNSPTPWIHLCAAMGSPGTSPSPRSYSIYDRSISLRVFLYQQPLSRFEYFPTLLHSFLSSYFLFLSFSPTNFTQYFSKKYFFIIFIVVIIILFLCHKFHQQMVFQLVIGWSRLTVELINNSRFIQNIYISPATFPPAIVFFFFSTIFYIALVTNYVFRRAGEKVLRIVFSLDSSIEWIRK